MLAYFSLLGGTPRNYLILPPCPIDVDIGNQ